MKGNDREAQRHRIEDRIIRRLDNPENTRYVHVNLGPLRVSLLELAIVKTGGRRAVIDATGWK